MSLYINSINLIFSFEETIEKNNFFQLQYRNTFFFTLNEKKPGINSKKRKKNIDYKFLKIELKAPDMMYN